MSNQSGASPKSSPNSEENLAKDWEKSKRTLEEYRRETVKAVTSLSKLIAVMGRIIFNEHAAGQIKRMAQQAIDVRELCQQHAMQIDQLESWLGCSGVELYSPPPAPRRPPAKRARLGDSIESESAVAEWCRQVTAEESNLNLCRPCTVVLPSSLNRLVRTISKKTRRDPIEICNTFQYNVGDGNQADEVAIELPVNVKLEEKDESIRGEEPGSEISSRRERPAENIEESKEIEAVDETILDLSGRSPRKCAAKFSGRTGERSEEKPGILKPLEDLFEFSYNENDEGNLMRRITFRICDYVDAVARRVFLDPWIPYGYSGEEQITKVVKANVEGALREISRRYVAQPWRQFKGTPFHFNQEVDVTYILPSGRLLTVPLGYIQSQTKSTSFGKDFMLANSVRVQLSRSSGEGIILIKGEPVPCSLIKSGPIRPDDYDWQPRLPLRPGQSSAMSFAQRRLESLRTSLAEKTHKEE